MNKLNTRVKTFVSNSSWFDVFMQSFEYKYRYLHVHCQKKYTSNHNKFDKYIITCWFIHMPWWCKTFKQNSISQSARSLSFMRWVSLRCRRLLVQILLERYAFILNSSFPSSSSQLGEAGTNEIKHEFIHNNRWTESKIFLKMAV